MVGTPPRHAPPTGDTGCPADRRRAAGRGVRERTRDRSATAIAGETVLWRMRTTVRDEPGSLAALCAALAGQRVDILSLQTHPLAEGTVDEFLLRAPAQVAAADVTRAVVGRQAAPGPGSSGPTPTTWWTRPPGYWAWPRAPPWTRPNSHWRCGSCWGGARSGRCPPGRCAVIARTKAAPVEGALEDTVMRLRAPEGGVITVERPYLPFTPTEFARARALVELDARLGPRVPRTARTS